MANKAQSVNEWRELLTDRQGVVLAVLLTLGTIAVALLLRGEMRREFLAVVLVAIGAVYVGFALAEHQRGSLGIEVAYAAATLGVALLGLWHSPYWLAAGYLAHGAWDLVHHPQRHVLGTRAVPRWYVPACVVYDWAIGAFVLLPPV